MLCVPPINNLLSLIIPPQHELMSIKYLLFTLTYFVTSSSLIFSFYMSLLILFYISPIWFVVQRRKTVVDGSSTELINGLACTRCVKITVFQCLHKKLCYFPLCFFLALNIEWNDTVRFQQSTKSSSLPPPLPLHWVIHRLPGLSMSCLLERKYL
jgi:hypothetical protein